MSRRTARSPATGLTLAETIVVNGVLPVIVLGVLLPVGAVAFCLALKGAPVRQSVEHGELLLGAGNAAMVGSFTYLASRPSDSVIGTAGALCYLIFGGVFPYLGWASIAVDVITDAKYSHAATEQWGAAAVIATAAMSLYCVSKTFRPPEAVAAG